MKITAIFLNRDAVQFSLETQYKFDPQYRTVHIELTEEQVKLLTPMEKEMLSQVFLEEE